MGAAALEGVAAVCRAKGLEACNGSGAGVTPTDAVASVNVEAGRIAAGVGAGAVAGGRGGAASLESTVGRPRAGAEDEEEEDEEDDEELEDEEEDDLAAPLVI
mmetsp:Transcript_98599/g.195623  ORF Transcript_98599/g.195623 Transcript_98599/m.195623 type:complete len:103 (-) Transcript_98599:1361-1669(-)